VLILLNVLALVPLAIMLVWMAIWWGIASAGRAPSAGIDIPWWLAIAAIILIVLPVHELLHGLTITYFGHPATYGMKLSKGVLYATSENALFRRNDEYIAVALAPLGVITLAAMALMLIVPQGLAYYIALAAVLNAGGAVGDLWSVALLLRYPTSVLVRDEADGFRVYADSRYAEGSSIQNSAPPSAG
jgi:hypothetical protein